jgi:hypothetical protein
MTPILAKFRRVRWLAASEVPSSFVTISALGQSIIQLRLVSNDPRRVGSFCLAHDFRLSNTQKAYKPNHSNAAYLVIA